MQTLGDFFREKRLDLGMDERAFAKLVGYSAFRIKQIENGHSLEPHQQPNQSILTGISEALNLNDNEKELMFELAEKLKENNTQTVTPTLDYIHANKSVRKALKAGREVGATDEDWEKIADEFIKRKTGRDDI